MREGLKVCLLNDSFPPLIDGVANTIINYADIIYRKYGTPVVATPNYPGDKKPTPYKVVRYPSIDTSKLVGYRAGVPFLPSTIIKLEREKPDIIHCHCPAMSGILARELREVSGAPIVFTYHTKFDIDIEAITEKELFRKVAREFLLQNINASDEVWTVSEGAGKNLRKLGYTGDYRIMSNGVDFPRGRAESGDILRVKRKFGIKDKNVLMFTGRIRWYKGLRILLDAVKMLISDGFELQVVFVGDGSDKSEIEEYAQKLGIREKCVFTGAVTDRTELRALFCSADLFTFLSTFDTNGIVVREAAACAVPSLLIKDSCAAEGVEDQISGFLCEENSESAAKAISNILKNPQRLSDVGLAAQEKIYISWDEAVFRAYERYGEILDGYRPRRRFKK